MPETELIQIGAVAILFLFAIREFFAFLKTRNGKNPINQIKTDIALIQQQLTNHMTDYNKCIERVERMVKQNTKSIDEIRSAMIRIDAKLKE